MKKLHYENSVKMFDSQCFNYVEHKITLVGLLILANPIQKKHVSHSMTNKTG